jgi:uncharacterized protein (DUF58 family)
MIFTWGFILLIFAYALILLWLPSSLFGLLLLLGLVIFWLLDWALTRRETRITVTRNFSNPTYQHTPFRVELTFSNPTRRPLRIVFKDEPPPSVETKAIHNTVYLPPASNITYTYEAIPPKRGSFAFGGVNLRYPGILYLFSRQYRIELPEPLRVFPNLGRLGDYRFERLKITDQEGIHRRRSFGFGGELAQLRRFASGDDYRRINWKVTAHSGELTLNCYEPERNQNVFLIIDTGRLLFDQKSGIDNRLDYILDSAILLAFNILISGDMAGALAFDHQIERFVPLGKGRRHLEMLVESCFDLEAVMAESDYRAAFRFCQNKLNKRSLLFVYSDITDIESSRELIRHLQFAARRHLVVCVLLKKEILVELAESKIVDEETAYLKGTALELLAERETLKKALAANGVKVLEVDCANINRAVVDHYLYLKKQGLF